MGSATNSKKKKRRKEEKKRRRGEEEKRRRGEEEEEEEEQQEVRRRGPVTMGPNFEFLPPQQKGHPDMPKVQQTTVRHGKAKPRRANNRSHQCDLCLRPHVS